MTRFRILAAALMIALAAPVLAADTVVPGVASRAKFDAFKEKVTSALDTDAKIAPADKHAALAALARIESRYDHVANPDLMGEADRMETYNDQELIKTIATHAEPDSRMICERDTPTGSHQIKVFCMTVAMRKEREKTGQDAMHRSANNTYPGATTMKPGTRR